jgi:hypothetical protein
MPKSRLSAFLSLLFVFASGAATGAVGYRLYLVKTVVSSANTAPRKSSDEFRKLIVSRLKDAIKLDDQQLIQVQKVYDDEGNWFMQEHKKFKSMVDQIHRQFANERDSRHEDSIAKIKAILRPDQEPLYDKWLADRAANRERRQKQEHQQDEGKKPILP